MPNLDQPTVLIVSDQAEFSSALIARWQTERSVPAFTLMRGDLCQKLDAEAFQVAVVGEVRPRVLPKVLKALQPARRPVLLMSEDAASARKLRDSHPRVQIVRQAEDWLDVTVVLASEMLRHSATTSRLERLEKENAFLQRQAALGAYMLEMRHTLNNALTSVLGNSELVLSEPGALSAEARSQLETVRNMALRMHEVLQRFSSLEKEMKVVETQEAREASSRRRSASAGR
ncbi:MAG TPA: hypothetical protein VLV49_13490 [Terriglobales bacterium]|nr:hypothetical protein [Terriglobales bacterium]